MKVVISNFSTNKTHYFRKTLPALLLILIFVSCSTSNSPINNKDKHVIVHEKANSKDKIRERIINNSKKLIGSKYRYGGKNPKSGFDCSGFVYYIYKNEGIYLPGSSKSQSKIGKIIDLNKCKPGDLVYFKNKGKINHVGIVVENTKTQLFIIHSTSSLGVKKDDIWSSKYWKKRVTFARDVIAN